MDPQLPKLTSNNRARRARRIHRLLSATIGLMIAIAVVSLVVAYAISESKINHEYNVDASELILASTARDPSRGERLVRGLLRCTECHENDLAGKVIVDTEIGRVASPNLTRGSGGIGASLKEADWVRALRHGVGRDGHGLWMMPVSRFHHLNDRDIGDVIAYLTTIPPIDRTTEVSQLGLLGRLVHAMGKLELIDAHPKRLDEGHAGSTDSISQGHYLSHLAGCRACHGEDLRGGEGSIGADLVGGSFSRWGFKDFTKAMRQGIRPDAQAMPEEMPWPEFGRLTDEELKQLFDYLASLRSAG